jgi:hypothetical protein
LGTHNPGFDSIVEHAQCLRQGVEIRSLFYRDLVVYPTRNGDVAKENPLLENQALLVGEQHTVFPHVVSLFYVNVGQKLVQGFAPCVFLDPFGRVLVLGSLVLQGGNCFRLRTAPAAPILSSYEAG